MRFFSLVLVFMAVSPIYACSSTETTSTTIVTTTTNSIPPSPQTYGEAANLGASVYALSCASCHGATGQGGIGPELIGAGIEFDDISNALELYDYIRLEMPQNAPGSLPEHSYLNTLGFLLVRNNIVAESVPFDDTNFQQILITGGGNDG